MKSLKIAFLVLFPVTLLILIVESFTFRYFFLKHLYINSDLLMALVAAVSIAIIIFLRKSKTSKLENILKIYLLLSKLGFMVGYLIYFILIFIDDLKYSNYIFSKYHIQPGLLTRPIFLCLFIVTADFISKRIKLNKFFYRNFLSISLISLIAIFGLTNFVTDVSDFLPNLILIVKTENLNKDTKYAYIMQAKYGYYYDYMEFVKTIVPENSSILIPPQINPWQFEGNQRLDRYFLYPRTLYSTGEVNLPGNYDYILIAWGNSAFPPDKGDLYGWPRFKIKAEDVYIYDINTKTFKVYQGDYDPEKYLKDGVYGLIKTK